jgi:hypothetical protein
VNDDDGDDDDDDEVVDVDVENTDDANTRKLPRVRGTIRTLEH